MEKEINVVGWGMLPCLHCGEISSMSKDIHLCNAPRNQWLDEQDRVYVEMPGVGLWDLKTKKVIKRYVGEGK